MIKASFGVISLTPKIHISIFSVFNLLFFFMSQGVLYSLIFLSAAALHELSHIFFLHLFEADIGNVTIYPFGIDIVCDTSRLSYKKELIVTLAGSLANIFFSLMGYAAMFIIPSVPLLFFVLCNAFLGVFNLIPLSFFDGGRALRLLFYDRFSIDEAFYLSRYADIFSSLIFLLLSLGLLNFSDFNFSVCALIIYAAISCLVANTNLYTKTP